MGRLFCFVAQMSEAKSGAGVAVSPEYRFAHPGYEPATILVQAAEGVDQDQNRNRHAEQPQQQITSHDELLHRRFDGLIRSGCTCSDYVGTCRVGKAKRAHHLSG